MFKLCKTGITTFAETHYTCLMCSSFKVKKVFMLKQQLLFHVLLWLLLALLAIFKLASLCARHLCCMVNKNI